MLRAWLVRRFCLIGLTHTVLRMPCGQGNVDVRVARIFNTFGPRMNPSDGRVVSNFIVQVKSAPALLSVFAAACCLGRPRPSLSCTRAQAVATRACASGQNRKMLVLRPRSLAPVHACSACETRRL